MNSFAALSEALVGLCVLAELVLLVAFEIESRRAVKAFEQAEVAKHPLAKVRVPTSFLGRVAFVKELASEGDEGLRRIGRKSTLLFRGFLLLLSASVLLWALAMALKS